MELDQEDIRVHTNKNSHRGLEIPREWGDILTAAKRIVVENVSVEIVRVLFLFFFLYFLFWFKSNMNWKWKIWEGLWKYCFSFELCFYIFHTCLNICLELRARLHPRKTCLFIFACVCICVCREDSRQEKKDCVWEERGGVCYAASGTLVVGEEDPDPRTDTQYHWGCHQAKIHTLIPDIRHNPDTTQTLDTNSRNRT